MAPGEEQFEGMLIPISVPPMPPLPPPPPPPPPLPLPYPPYPPAVVRVAAFPGNVFRIQSVGLPPTNEDSMYVDVLRHPSVFNESVTLPHVVRSQKIISSIDSSSSASTSLGKKEDTNTF